MSKSFVCAILALFFLVGVFVTIFYQDIPYYSEHTYEADVGKEWLWRARATNDLGDMVKYLDESLVCLDGYSGNPCWWYPKPDTDYDYIKQNIREVRNNAVNWSSSLTGDSYAYQQAVQNLQETIIEITDHLSIANGWNNNPMFFDVIYIFMMILFSIFLILSLTVFID